MSLNLAEENTGWKVALEIALERDKNVQRLCKAVMEDDHRTAKLLAKELKDDKEGAGIVESFHGRPSRRR